MPKWEYQYLDGVNQLDTDGRGPPDHVTEEQLNAKGAEGWEVVTGNWETSYGVTYMTRVLLKRHTPEEKVETPTVGKPK